VAEITAGMVKRLRDATNAGMMACKQALIDADGDFDKAAELVRERTGAKMDARAAERTAKEGMVHAYLHQPAPGVAPKVGVLVQLSCETDFVAKTDTFQQLARDIALHIAFAKPLVVARDQLDPVLVDKEREFARRQALEEGKPEHIVERIVEGRIESYFQEVALLDQPFVKDDKRTVLQLITEVQGVLGEKVEVARFARFQVGA
jgi:elongation factor Ts